MPQLVVDVNDGDGVVQQRTQPQDDAGIVAVTRTVRGRFAVTQEAPQGGSVSEPLPFSLHGRSKGMGKLKAHISHKVMYIQNNNVVRRGRTNRHHPTLCSCKPNSVLTYEIRVADDVTNPAHPTQLTFQSISEKEGGKMRQRSHSASEASTPT